jgi:glycosyltransferase involved in cell wall biosynthesis
MKISWLSNSPWTPSGYGQQTRMFLPRIKSAGVDVVCLATVGLESGSIIFDGYQVLPKRFHPYGNDVAITHSTASQCNAMISLIDIWVMNVEEYPLGFRWVPWYPVDHDPLPNIIRNKLLHSWRRIAMSKFGVEMTHNAGLDCLYVPHGVDTSVFHPIDKKEAREALHLPLDKWIVGTVAMNKGTPSRKSFCEMLEAFANFHKRHPDTMYVLQTGRGDDGVAESVNLPEMAGLLGLVEGKDFIFPNQYGQMVGFDTGYMANIYNALDVHMTVSTGEGFGIPIIEAQACGTPVIVGDWTAMSELCFAGRKIDKKDADRQFTALAAYQYRPRVRAIELALEAEYKNPSPTANAVKTIQQEYDVEQVMVKHWVPVLQTLQADIEKVVL